MGRFRRVACYDPIGRDADGRRIGLQRWRLFGGVFLIYLGYALADLFQRDSLDQQIAGLFLMAVFIAAYLLGVPLGMFTGPGWRRYPAVLVMAASTVVYLVVAGRGGLIFVTYICVALVVTQLPIVSAPLVAGLFVGVTFLPQHVASWDLHGEQWGTGAPALLTALAMYGVRAGASSQIQLHQAREEVATLAAEQERLRIARDLHDLLGHALTTVVVKAELASRLAERDPVRAAREMAEVAELGRQGLADVRATVAGYRSVSLGVELATAREVLSAAGIVADLPAAAEDVPAELRELFGWVVREGITNVVRHSRATRVSVNLAGNSIEVLDDGVGCSGAAVGSGLAGLGERVREAGGRLVTGRAEPVGFRLHVQVPA